LQRQGRMGTYASIRGQEAAQIGSASCIEKDDLIFPAFRETGVFMVRGFPPELIYTYWAGDERGMRIPEKINMFPISITVGAHLPHAVGAAMGFKIQKKKAASIVYFGDGATSEGDFHESMNFAGAFKAPCVFINQNNQWAISLSVKEQTASKTIAQKAIAYGFEGVKVDGNDVFAVYKATQDALKKARDGKGPTLIECFTYRIGDHTTSDDAKKYRLEKEVKEWEKKDPISRLKKYMLSKKMFSDEYEKDVLAKAERDVDSAVDKMESMVMQSPEDFFKFMYAEMTPDLEEQLEMMKTSIAEMKTEKKEAKSETSKAKEKGMGVVGELEEA
jgi:pyruvate dehydrogenase E1 component alpha subunit